MFSLSAKRLFYISFLYFWETSVLKQDYTCGRMFLRSGAGVLPTSGCHLREIAGYKFSLSYMLYICLNFDILNIKWDCQEYCMFLNHSPIVKKKKYPKIWFFPGREEENLDVTCFSWLNGVGRLVTWKKQMASSPLGKPKNVKNIRQTLRGAPKKVTNRMLLKPWWTGSITSSRHLMCLEIVFWSLLSKTNQDQALPSHFVGTIWPHLTQFRLGCFSVSYFILGPLVTVIILQMASRLLRKS